MIVLDTHTLIWWVNQSNQLSSKANQIIKETLDKKSELLVSSTSAWEIALLVHKGHLTLTMEVNKWIATAAAIDGLRYVPIDNEMGIHSVQLPCEFHADPADRMIVALARQLNLPYPTLPLVTADQRILAYTHVKTIW